MKNILHPLISTLLIAAFSSHALDAPYPENAPTVSPGAQLAGDQVAKAALERTKVSVTYNNAYRSLSYPGGDVPADEGVCTDVVIRTYRALGIDLQVLVHEDMRANFSAYPNHWGLTSTDRNIDHRRVPNLETFFKRAGSQLPTNVQKPDVTSFEPGDIVSWRLPDGLPHIGMVSSERVPDTNRYFIVHNNGHGPRSDDVLLSNWMMGHYRYLPIVNTSEKGI